MKDKIILVTGSTDGIGKQTARDLALMGATVILHGREPSKGQQVQAEIKDATANAKIDLFIADLASFEQIRQMAKLIHNAYDNLHVLINNAGVVKNEHEINANGYEMTFAVNHLAVFLFTQLLIDLMKKGAPSRIINVSSMVYSSFLDFDRLAGKKQFNGWEAYCQSKLCTILFSYELAQRLEGTGVTVNCLHPGVIDTKLLRANFSGGSPISEGSKTPVYLATAPELEKVTGKYFAKKKETRTTAVSYDPAIRKKLWQLSEQMCGVNFSG
jgi:NAD(P)-dependent dehydrogenase (short-subunit alcohol dehydrogenase family)